ncbi:hypothetical protein PIB30_095876 [Stylosanthes scabra]|uniref:Uncharacterized protein n=1 Tax=Stylosanthes scabra TaxID=79078 RepID=A0ABU6RWU2_9FABA|nr:hypothetical protein [Stylosanthes scabra]
MLRVKQTGRRTTVDPNALPMPPRLSQLPEERWFEDDNERLAYDVCLSKIEIFPPKFIGDGVLPDEKYPDFWRLINIQGLRPFLYMRERYYPRFVAAAYTTLYIQDGLNDEGNGRFVPGFRLGGRSYEFPLTTLANIWGLKDEGITFKGGNNPHGIWNEFNKLDAIRGLRLEQAASGKYAISRLSTDHRLLLYVLSYVLLPRKSNHGSASEEDLIILSTMTRIFEIAPLDPTREEDVEPEISYAISSKNIHQMWRSLVDHVEVDEDAGVDAMADAQPRVETDAPSQIPTETGVPPQFQPDIAEFVRKGFEEMRSMMTEGFARLLDRIDRLDTHMISQDTDLRNLRDKFRSFHGEKMYMDFREQPEDTPMQD